MTITRFNDSDTSTLANICLAAVERFKGHAAEFDKLADMKAAPEGSLLPTGNAARGLADQFRKQAAEATKFASIFFAADPFEVETDDEDEAETA